MAKGNGSNVSADNSIPEDNLKKVEALGGLPKIERQLSQKHYQMYELYSLSEISN